VALFSLLNQIISKIASLSSIRKSSSWSSSLAWLQASRQALVQKLGQVLPLEQLWWQ
jgi:hypothetical protein